MMKILIDIYVRNLIGKMARPYEKMYLIDEYEYMNLKNIGYPESAKMAHTLQTRLVMKHLAMMTMMMMMVSFHGSREPPSVSSHAPSSPHVKFREDPASPSFREPTPPPRPPPTSTPIPKDDHEEILAQIEANRLQVAKEVDDATQELARSILSISRIEEEEKEHVEEWNGLNAAIRERIWNNLEALMDQHEYMVAI